MSTTKTENRIYHRDGIQYGIDTGATKKCMLAGCQSQRVGVRWEDGHITWPCLKGLKGRPDGSLQIE